MQWLKGAGNACRGRAFAAALLLMAAAAPLDAAIYQCQGADGSTVYADKPCGSDARLIIVRPQAPLSNTPPGLKRTPPGVSTRARPSSNELSPATHPSPDQDALQCQGRQYLAWYKRQEPKPTREQSDAMMRQIVVSCGASSLITTAADAAAAEVKVQQIEVSAPQVAGGGAGMLSAPRDPAAPYEVSRSRQATEAARWEGYYACRTKTFQGWADSLGHRPDSGELQAARLQIDGTCRDQFSLPAGPAATLVD